MLYIFYRQPTLIQCYQQSTKVAKYWDLPLHLKNYRINKSSNYQIIFKKYHTDIFILSIVRKILNFTYNQPEMEKL